MSWDEIPDSTPLDPQEARDLIPSHIQTQAELNEWEQTNIVSAVVWSEKVPFVLELPLLLQLHKKMFDKTWKWAGKIRKSDKNIGVHWTQITANTLELLEDVKYQIEHQTFEPDQIAVRFHHRLVSIHPFPNGNGRHARLMADLLLQSLGRSRFSWGGTDLSKAGETRKRYISALKSADSDEYQELLTFVRSGR